MHFSISWIDLHPSTSISNNQVLVVISGNKRNQIINSCDPGLRSGQVSMSEKWRKRRFESEAFMQINSARQPIRTQARRGKKTKREQLFEEADWSRRGRRHESAGVPALTAIRH